MKAGLEPLDRESNALGYAASAGPTLAALLRLSSVFFAGVGAERLPTASRFQILCLRNLWMAIPRKVSRASDGKGPFNDLGASTI